jgi:hypothetical protein
MKQNTKKEKVEFTKHAKVEGFLTVLALSLVVSPIQKCLSLHDT